MLAATPAAADRLVAPSDLAPRGTVSAEAGGRYTRASLDLPMDDPYLHTVAASIRARVAVLDGVLLGVAQGAVVDQRVEAYNDDVTIDAPTGVGDLALTADGLLPLGAWKAGARVALWLPTGSDELSNDAVALDVELVGALRTSRRVELFATAGHQAADAPDAIEVALGVHARDDNWSFVPRARLRFDSPVDDADRGAVGYGGELAAAIELIPDVSFRLLAGLERDRIVAAGGQPFATTTLTVAGFIQGTRDLF
jgi:hypothetical protein